MGYSKARGLATAPILFLTSLPAPVFGPSLRIRPQHVAAVSRDVCEKLEMEPIQQIEQVICLEYLPASIPWEVRGPHMVGIQERRSYELHIPANMSYKSRLPTCSLRDPTVAEIYLPGTARPTHWHVARCQLI